PALLETVGGFQAVGVTTAVKYELANNRMGVRSRGRDEGDVGKRRRCSRRITLTRTRDHDQMMLRIETEFVSSGCPADRDSVGAAQIFLAWVLGIKYPDPPRPRARSGISDPKLGDTVLMDGHHAVGTGGVVVASEAREISVCELFDAVVRRIDDLDRLVAAV